MQINCLAERSTQWHMAVAKTLNPHSVGVSGWGGVIFLTPGRQHFLKVFLDISQGGLNEVVMVSCLGPAVIEKGQLLIKTTQRHHDTFVCFVALF